MFASSNKHSADFIVILRPHYADFTVEPVKAVYAAKLKGETTYDDLKKMCDGMLAKKDDRWSLRTCLVRQSSPAT